MSTLLNFLRRRALFVFVAATPALTFATILLPLPREVLPLLIVFIPALTALALAALEAGRPGVAALLAQFAPSRNRLAWLGLALGLALALRLAVALAAVLSGAAPDLQPGPASPLLVLTFLFAAGEQIGWRGYVWPKLRAAGVRSPFVAGLLIGVPWAALHLVLFLPGMMFAGLPVLPPLLAIVALSVLITWLCERGGLWAAVALHGGQNALVFLNTALDPVTGNLLMALVYGVAAVVVMLAATRPAPWPATAETR